MSIVAQAVPRAPDRHALADEMEAALRRHVLGAWFPRCLDREYGGYLCDFDHAWRAHGPQGKMLEFQARQTCLAARAARAYAGEAWLAEAALHGFRYLRDVIWDRAHGGWFRMLDRAGAPLEAETKHAHGIAYAIEACVAVHEATRERGTLELAQEGFDWLERKAYDERHGGYLAFLRRDGTPITEGHHNPLTPVGYDSIGTPVGCKDANVHSDFLETFSDLVRAWPDLRVRRRLAELRAIVRDRMTVANGAMHHFFESDWTPMPDVERYGYEMQAARRLGQAESALGGDQQEATCCVIRSLVRRALECGWDDAVGGMAYSGPDGPHANPDKLWWVQAEVLRTLLIMAVEYPDPGADHLDYFNRQWRYIREHVFDRVHGGWLQSGGDGIAWRRVLLRRRHARRSKGDEWKDGSHDGVALLHCVRLLRGVPADAPL